MTNEFIFEFKAPISNLEYMSDRDSLKVSGLVLRLGEFTRNGRRYQINEAEDFIKELKGTPLFFKSTRKGLHINTDKAYVGRVLGTNKQGVTLFGDVEVWNTPEYPNIVQQIQESWERNERWGLSLGGRAMVMIPTGKLNSNFRPMFDVKKMMPNHIQLLEPNEPRGDPDAQILSIGESFELYEAFNKEELVKEIFDEVTRRIDERYKELLEKFNKEQENAKTNEDTEKIVNIVNSNSARPTGKRKVNIILKGTGSGDKVDAKRK
jgi:hypothetical protein